MTALVIALLVLFLGVRPLAKACSRSATTQASTRPRWRSAGFAPRQQAGRQRRVAGRSASTCSRRADAAIDDRVGAGARLHPRQSRARRAGGARHDQGGRHDDERRARSYTGVERAAVLMMLVGEEEAAAILQKLDPEEVRQLGSAMFEVADVERGRGRATCSTISPTSAREPHRRSPSIPVRRSRA